MGTIHKRALIPAPPAAVYRYIADVHNAPGYISAIQRIVEGPPGPAAPGGRYQAQAVFMGKPTGLTLRVLGLVPLREVALALEGDPAAVVVIRLAPDRGGTATRVEVSLEAPSIAGFLLNMTMGGMLSESLARLVRTMQAAGPP